MPWRHVEREREWLSLSETRGVGLDWINMKVGAGGGRCVSGPQQIFFVCVECGVGFFFSQRK